MQASLKPCRIPAALRKTRQFRLGRRVEREHTTSQRAADCITFHHLAEEAEKRRVPLMSSKLRYYTDLLGFEKKWTRRG